MTKTPTQPKPPAAKSSATQAANRRYMLLVAVGLIAVAGIVAAIMAFGGKPPAPPKNKPAQGPPMVDRVLAMSIDLMKKEQYKPAIELMQAYVQGQPQDAEVRPLLAQAYMFCGQNHEAELELDEVLRLPMPVQAEVLWLKGEVVRRRGGKHLPFYKKAAESTIGATPDLWARYGTEMLKEGDLAESEKYLQKALAAGLKDGRTLGGLAEIARKQNKPSAQVQELLAAAIAVDKTNPRLYLMMAEMLRQDSKADAAAQTLLDGLKLCRDKGQLLMQVADIRQGAGRTVEAAELYADATDYLPLRADASFKAAGCYYQLKRYAMAMKYIDMALAQRPDDSAARELATKIENERFVSQ